MAKASVSAVDYVVICGFLSLSVGIGMYYAIRGRRRNTREEYLMGGRRLHVIPVTLSLCVTYLSSTSFVGMPAETFSSGFTYAFVSLGCAVAMFITVFTVVPLMHSLQLTSLYEYFQLRFGSVVLRRCISVLGMVQNIFYAAVILLAPAVSIETVAGLPLWVSVLLVGAVATLYTAIGGLRGVVAVDVFQALILAVGLYSILFKGVYDIGGIGLTWDLAVQGGRVPPVDFSADPHVRHSFWSLVVGGAFMFMAYIFDQSAIQRMCSLPSVRQAKLVYAATGVVVSIYVVSISFLGLVAYSYYTVQGCDPFKAGYLKNRNQLVPYFMMEIFNGLPGMSGLFLATIFSAGLSSVSSIINGLAANTIEDLLRPVFDRYNTAEKGKIFTAKMSVFFYGGLCVCLSFVAWSLPGTVIQAAMGIGGACSGPVLGVFLLGAAAPWGNITGAVSGLLVSLVLNVWIALGGIMYGRRPVPLPPAPVNSCHVPDVANITGLYLPDPVNNTTGLYLPDPFNNTAGLYLPDPFNNTTGLYLPGPFNNTTGHQDIRTSSSSPVPGNNIDSGDYSLYNISYLYYAMVGCLVAFSVGLVVSLATKHRHEPVRDERLLLPFVRRFWSPSQTDASRQTEKQGDPDTHSMEGLQTQEQLITTEVFPNPVSDML